MSTIVELGSGTGVITQEILKRARPGARVICIEFEPTYIPLLREKFGDRVIIENESAHRMDEILLKHGITKVDLIISSLPILPGDIKEKIFASIRRHTESGTVFRFITYMAPIVRRVYRELPIQKKSFTFWNIPPVWVFGIN
jgi:phospholipid N-methyltransferase